MTKDEINQIPVTILALKEYIKILKPICKRNNDILDFAQQRLDQIEAGGKLNDRRTAL